MSIRFGRSGGNYSSSEVMQTDGDDWRKIEDATERRRIQNRLAQRNYRRKLRAKLEELEKKAGEGGAASSSSERRAEKGDKVSSSSPVAPESQRQATPQPTSGTLSHFALSHIHIPEQLAPQSSGYAFDVTLEQFLDSMEDMLGPLPSFPPAPIDNQGPMTSGSVEEVPISSGFDAAFTSRESSAPSDHNPLPANAIPHPILGHVILPSFSPDSPDRSTTSHGLMATDYMPSPAPSSTLESEPGTPTSKTCPIRDGFIKALANLNFPPGFNEVIPRESFLKQKTSVQQILNSTHPPVPNDAKFVTVQFGNIFHASILNGIILSFDSLAMIDEDAISPFNSDIAIPNNIPKDLIPTALQRSIPHHPYIDIVPFPGFREKLLRFMDLIDEDEVCTMMHTDWGVWGSRPWDKTSWEIGEKFAEKYWFLMDEDMKRSSDFWRGQRGLTPLKHYGRKSLVERGKVLGETP